MIYSMNKLAIGVDIGGSHITCMAVDLENNQPIVELFERNQVDSLSTKEGILSSWAAALKLLIDKLPLNQLVGIGLAMPGPFDYLNGIALFKGVKKFDSLYGVDVKKEIQDRLGLSSDFPVRFLNDATCFAIGESWLGKASDYKKVIAITLGTGFGTAFINNGLPVTEGKGVPKEGCLYHVPFKKSIADEYFSTRWFIKEYKSKSGQNIKGVNELVKITETSEEAMEVFEQFGENMGEFMLKWIKDFKADCIIIGGNISKSYGLFQRNLNTKLIKGGTTIPIFISELDEKAALIGSAKLCDLEFYKLLIK